MNPRLLIIFTALLLGCSGNLGEELPDFSGPTVEGKTLSRSDLKGKITVVNLWGTWCGPCRKEIPYLNELAERLGSDTNFAFIAVTEEKDWQVERFLRENPFHFRHICSPEVYELLHPRMVKTIPYFLVTDKQGRVIFEQTGAFDGYPVILEELLRKERNKNQAEMSF